MIRALVLSADLICGARASVRRSETAQNFLPPAPLPNVRPPAAQYSGRSCPCAAHRHGAGQRIFDTRGLAASMAHDRTMMANISAIWRSRLRLWLLAHRPRLLLLFSARRTLRAGFDLPALAALQPGALHAWRRDYRTPHLVAIGWWRAASLCAFHSPIVEADLSSALAPARWQRLRLLLVAAVSVCWLHPRRHCRFGGRPGAGGHLWPLLLHGSAPDAGRSSPCWLAMVLVNLAPENPI